MENIALENLKTRRSVRSFSSRPIEQEKLDAILEAATYAPTGMGSQSPAIVLVKTPETLKKVSRLNARVMGRDMDPFTAHWQSPSCSATRSPCRLGLRTPASWPGTS